MRERGENFENKRVILPDFSKEVGMAASERQFSSSRNVLSRGHFDKSSWILEI